MGESHALAGRKGEFDETVLVEVGRVSGQIIGENICGGLLRIGLSQSFNDIAGLGDDLADGAVAGLFQISRDPRW